MSVCNRYVMEGFSSVLCCHFAFWFFSVSVGAFVIGLIQISSFFSLTYCWCIKYQSLVVQCIWWRGNWSPTNHKISVVARHFSLKLARWNGVKADMKSYITLETAAIFFLANLFPKQGISSEYVTADFICMGLLGLQGAKTENYKMKNSCPYRDSNSRPLILKLSAFSMRLSSLIYKRKFKTALVE